MSYKSIKDVAEQVEGAGGLAVFSLGELRDAAGYGRITAGVLAEILNQLDGFGMDALGQPESPLRQGDELRIYKRNAPVGEVIGHVLRPSEAGDARLLEIASRSGEDVLKQVRALVCA